MKEYAQKKNEIMNEDTGREGLGENRRGPKIKKRKIRRGRKKNNITWEA